MTSNTLSDITSLISSQIKNKPDLETVKTLIPSLDSRVDGYEKSRLIDITVLETKHSIAASKETNTAFFMDDNGITRFATYDAKSIDNIANEYGSLHADKLASQINKQYKFVTEAGRSGGQWYRVWNDGFVEQGGIYQTATSGTNTINFLKPYGNTKYTILLNYISLYASTVGFYGTVPNTKSTTGFTLYYPTHITTEGLNWYACG